MATATLLQLDHSPHIGGKVESRRSAETRGEMRFIFSKPRAWWPSPKRRRFASSFCSMMNIKPLKETS